MTKWQQEMQSIWDVFCAGAKYMTPRLPPSLCHLSVMSLISSFWRCPSDLISSACCNNWHWRTHTVTYIHHPRSNKTQAAFQSITISLSLHPSRLEQKSEFPIIYIFMVYIINQLNVSLQFYYTLQAHLKRVWSFNSRMSGRVQHYLGEFASMLYWTMLAACTVGPGTVVTCSR